MKNPLPWIFGLGVWVIGSVWFHLCQIKKICCKDQLFLTPISIIDGKDLDIKMTGLLYAQSGADLNTKPIRKELDSLASYLKTHPVRRVIITGYHTATENGHSIIPDLGMARSLSIKQYLKLAGIPDINISTHSTLTASIPFLNDSTNALSFAFDKVPDSENALALEQKFVDIFHLMELYFPTGSAQYIKTTDTDRFVFEATSYLKSHPSARLILTGHTDNIGSELSNKKLSYKRATEVSKLLSKQGIKYKQIHIEARGESQPKASNETEGGRKANRRVSIVVK